MEPMDSLEQIHAAAPPPAGEVGEQVELALPARGYVSLARTVTTALAARVGLTVEEIEEVRIAVDEACALLIPRVPEGGRLLCRYELADGRLTVTTSAECRTTEPLPEDSFSWLVLTTLAEKVQTGRTADQAYIRWSKSRATEGDA
ncbi:ATP-binding protein [Carbonactinospora thermoautotrophica]|nr:ATP-binding protein [Carbonactinospora thermoautotrophica]